MHDYYIGIDNGTSGTIGIIGPNSTHFIKTPIKKEQSYTKKKQGISRIKFHEFRKFIMNNTEVGKRFAIFERPLVNPSMFRTTMSAMRTLEAELIIIESLKIPYTYVDSKEWQKIFLPAGIKGSAQLKRASMDIGCRFFPEHSNLICRHKDADGLFIASWGAKKGL